MYLQWNIFENRGKFLKKYQYKNIVYIPVIVNGMMINMAKNGSGT